MIHPTVTSAAPDTKPRTRPLLATCLLALVVACSFLWRSWRQENRPGLVHLRRGGELAAAHSYPQAERELLLGIKEDPTFPGCYVQVGDIYAQAQRTPQAEKCYAAAAKYAPQDGSVWLKLATTEQQLGNTSEALTAARRAAQLLPGSADAIRLCGILAASQGDNPAAISALRRAHALRPDDRVATLALTQTELNVSDTAGAERDLTPYLQSHPQDTFACYLMAVIDNEKPRTPDNLRHALDYAQRALPGMADDLRIDVLLGQLYLNTHRPAEAMRIYQRGLHQFPYNKQILHGLMEGFQAVGDTQAVAYMATALKIAAARDNQIEHLKNVMGFNPKNIPAGLELARLEEEDGNLSLAQATYVMLMHQAPHDPRPHAALVEFYQRTGRPELAQQAARQKFVP